MYVASAGERLQPAQAEGQAAGGAQPGAGDRRRRLRGQPSVRIPCEAWRPREHIIRPINFTVQFDAADQYAALYRLSATGRQGTPCILNALVPIPPPCCFRQLIYTRGNAAWTWAARAFRISPTTQVICVDNFFTGSKDNIAQLIGKPNFELIRHDITERLVLEVDQIFHLACPASPVHYK